jgi:hypothetical protein
MSSSIHADELPPKIIPEDFNPKLAEASRETRRIPITRDKPIFLIKSLKAGLENFLISTCPRRRITGRAIRDYRKKRAPKPPAFIQRIAPTSL